MEDLSKLKPSTRSFWNKSIRDYTGLQTEDLLSVDYGSDTYAIRVALIQLHTQIERLRALRAPVVLQPVFPDIANGNLTEDVRQYGIEMEWIVTPKELELYWNELQANRQVFPLPMILSTRRD